MEGRRGCGLKRQNQKGAKLWLKKNFGMLIKTDMRVSILDWTNSFEFIRISCLEFEFNFCDWSNLTKLDLQKDKIRQNLTLNLVKFNQLWPLETKYAGFGLKMAFKTKFDQFEFKFDIIRLNSTILDQSFCFCVLRFFVGAQKWLAARRAILPCYGPGDEWSGFYSL